MPGHESPESDERIRIVIVGTNKATVNVGRLHT